MKASPLSYVICYLPHPQFVLTGGTFHANKMGEVIILSKVFPEFRCHSSFINDHLQRALNLDAQRSSHPIQVDCPDANQINQVR